MAKKERIKGTPTNWENGKLGTDEDYVVAASSKEELSIDAAIELKPISIRMPVDLISMLKLIAGHHGIGYQPMIRDVLTRFVRAEAREILIGMEEQKALKSALSDEESPAAKHLDKCA